MAEKIDLGLGPDSDSKIINPEEDEKLGRYYASRLAGMNPDTAALNAGLADKTGMSYEKIRSEPSPQESVGRTLMEAQIAKALKDNPEIQGWALQNSAGADMSADDIDSLVKTNKLMRGIKNWGSSIYYGWKAGRRTSEQGYLWNDATEAGRERLSDAARARDKEIDATLERYEQAYGDRAWFTVANIVSTGIYGAQEEIKRGAAQGAMAAGYAGGVAIQATMPSAFTGVAAGALGGAGATAFFGLVSTAAAGAAIGIGGTYAAYNGSRQVEAGLARKEMEEAGVDAKTAMGVSQVVGNINGLLEIVSLPLTVSVALKPLVDGTKRAVMSKVTKLAIRDAAKLMGEVSYSKAVYGTAKGLAAEAFAESFTEAAQELSTALGTEYAKHGNFKQLDTDALAQRVWGTFTTTLEAMAILGPLRASPGFALRMRGVHKAQQGKAFLEQLADVKGGSRLAARAPDHFGDWVAHSAAENDAVPQTLYVAADDFQYAMKQSGTTLEQIEAAVGKDVADQVRAADGSPNVDIEIPLKVYASRISNSNFDKALQPKIRMDEDRSGLTYEESVNLQGDIRRAMDAARADMAEWEAEQQAEAVDEKAEEKKAGEQQQAEGQVLSQEGEKPGEQKAEDEAGQKAEGKPAPAEAVKSEAQKAVDSVKGEGIAPAGVNDKPVAAEAEAKAAAPEGKAQGAEAAAEGKAKAPARELTQEEKELRYIRTQIQRQIAAAVQESGNESARMKSAGNQMLQAFFQTRIIEQLAKRTGMTPLQFYRSKYAARINGRNLKSGAESAPLRFDTPVDVQGGVKALRDISAAVQGKPVEGEAPAIAALRNAISAMPEEARGFAQRFLGTLTDDMAGIDSAQYAGALNLLQAAWRGLPEDIRASIEAALPENVRKALEAQRKTYRGTHGAEPVYTPRDEASGRGEALEQREVSTRVPTKKAAAEDPYNTLLVADYDALLNDRPMLSRVVDRLSKIPSLETAEERADREKHKDDFALVSDNEERDREKRLLDRYIDRMANNLLWLYELMPPTLRSIAKLWYDGGRSIAEGWGKRYGLPPKAIAAAIAVLSPQKDWFQNLSAAERVLDCIFGRRDMAWDAAMTAAALVGDKGKDVSPTVKESHVPLLEAILGEKLQYKMVETKEEKTLKSGKVKVVSKFEPEPGTAKRYIEKIEKEKITLGALLDRGDYVAAAVWIRAYDQAHNDRRFRTIAPDGRIFDSFVKTETGSKEAVVGWGSYGEIAKCVSVIMDPTTANISVQLGGVHKVRNFFNNLDSPWSPKYVTADTHQVAASLLLPMSTNSQEVKENFGIISSSESGLKGTYSAYLEACRRAAEKKGVLPREMQSITWEMVRLLFPKSLKDNKSKKTKEKEAASGKGEEKPDNGLTSEIGHLWSKWDGTEADAAKIREEIKQLMESKGAKLIPSWDVPQGTKVVDGTYDRSNVKLPPGLASADTQQFRFEIAPDPNNAALTARWNRLSFDERTAITQRVNDLILPEILDDFEIKGDWEMSVGGYLGATSPSISLRIDSPSAGLALARMLGYVYSQDSIAALEDQPRVGLDPNGSVVITLPKGFSVQQCRELYDELYKLSYTNLAGGQEHPVTGFSLDTAGSMVILNFSSKSDEELLAMLQSALSGRFPAASKKVYATWIEKSDYKLEGDRRANYLRAKAAAALEAELSAAEGRNLSKGTEQGGRARDAGQSQGAGLGAGGRAPEGSSGAAGEGRQLELFQSEQQGKLTVPEAEKAEQPAKKTEWIILATPEQMDMDATYAAAVEAGDEATAQQMLLNKAQRLGYDMTIPPDTPTYKLRTRNIPTKTIKAYKAFYVNPETGEPSALFASGSTPIPAGVWVDAKEQWHFTGYNGKRYIPVKGNEYGKGKKKGGGSEVPAPRDKASLDYLVATGFMTRAKADRALRGEKVTVYGLAFRPGWHAGLNPFFPQGGTQLVDASGDTYEVNGYPNAHEYNKVIYEIEVNADHDLTKKAEARAGRSKEGGLLHKEACFDRLGPGGCDDGFYYYTTNKIAAAEVKDFDGAWVIADSIKIVRALSQEEVDGILKSKGIATQPWVEKPGPDRIVKGKKKPAVPVVGRLHLEDINVKAGPVSDAHRKTIAPTYDADGNLIPFSKRFDASNPDVLYQTEENWSPDEELIARAKETFGTTKDPHEAFYLLPDGTMLDGSGRHWGGDERDVAGQRQVDHQDIGEVVDSSGAAAMYEWMARSGAARMDMITGIASIARPPTAKQLSALGRIYKGKYLALSFNTPEGRIVNDTEFESATPRKIEDFFADAQARYARGDIDGAYAQAGIEPGGAISEGERKLKAEAAAWAGKIEAMTEKPSQSVVMLTETPLVMKMVGANFRELKIAPHVMDGAFPGSPKSMPTHHEHPEMSKKSVEKLPEALADPIAIFRDPKREGRFVFMLEAEDDAGNTIIAPVQFEESELGGKVNVLKTAYGKESKNYFLRKEESEDLAYVNRKKMSQWKLISGSNSLRESTGYSSNILTEEDLARLKGQYPDHYQSAAAPARVPAKKPSGPLGMYNTRTNTLTLTDQANLSTFAHETGHWYLETIMSMVKDGYGDASLRGDVKILCEQFGIKSAEEFFQMAPEKKRVCHEQFAAWVEEYMGTGKVKDESLAGLFQRFGDWIIGVYKEVFLHQSLSRRHERLFGEKLPELSDEVRGVLDRMVGAERQQAQLEDSMGSQPLFAKKPDWVSEEEWEAYNQAIAARTQQGREVLMKKNLATMKWAKRARSAMLRKMQGEADAERAAIRQAVIERLVRPGTPYSQALILKSQPEGFKIRRESLAVDDDAAALLRKAGIVAAPGNGLDVSEVLQNLGTTDLEALVEAATDLADGSFEARVEQEVDLEMQAEHPAYASEEAMQAAADEALASQVADRVAAAELSMLRKLQAPGANGERLAMRTAANLPAKPLEELLKDFRAACAELEVAAANGDEKGVIEARGKRDLAAARIRWQDRVQKAQVRRDAQSAARDAAAAAKDQAAASRAAVAGAIADAREAAQQKEAAQRLAAARSSVEISVAMEAAKSTAASMPVGKLSAARFIRQARTAAQRSLDALAANSLEEAVKQKQLQLIYSQLARLALDAKQDVQKLERLGKRASGSDKAIAKSRMMPLVQAVRAMLSQVGVLPEKAGEKASAYIEKVKEYDPANAELIENLSAWAEGVTTNYKQMTWADFQEFKKSIDAMWELGRGLMVMEKDGRQEELADIREKIRAQLDKRFDGKRRGAPHSASGSKDQAVNAALRLFAGLRRVNEWCRDMDGGDPNGPCTTYIYMPMKKAADLYHAMQGETGRRLTRLFEDYNKTEAAKHRGAIVSDLVSYDMETGETDGTKFVFHNKAELLGALLHTGNASNKQKLIGGYGWGKSTVAADGSTVFDTRPFDDYIQKLVDQGVLTQDDFDLVQGLWNVMESLKPATQAAHKKITGRYFDEVTNVPFTVAFPDGTKKTYKGGYAPAKVDPLLVDDHVADADQALAGVNMSFAFPTTGLGFTKNRRKYYKPLLLDIQLVNNHVGEALKMAYLEPAAREVYNLVAGHDGLKGDIQAYGFNGKIVDEMIVPWLSRTVSQTVAARDPNGVMRAIGPAVSWLKTRAGLLAMCGNIGNALEEVSGFAVARSMVPGKYLLHAFAQYNFRQISAEDVMKKSVHMASRLNDTELYALERAESAIRLNPSKRDQAAAYLQAHGYFLQQIVQKYVDVPCWWAAYQHGLDRGMTEEEAVQHADNVIDATMGGNAAESISAFEVGTPLFRALTMFYSYFNMQLNLLYTETALAWKNHNYGRMAFAFATIVWLPQIISDMVSRAVGSSVGQGIGGGDDDDDTPEWMTLGILRYVAGQGMTGASNLLPGVSGFVKPAIDAVAGNEDTSFGGQRIGSSPVYGLGEAAIRLATKDIPRVADGTGYRTAVRDGVKVLSLLTGLPLDQPVGRPLGYLADVIEGNTDDDAVDTARGLLSGKSPNRTK